MDNNFVSLEPHEIKYITNKFKVPAALVRLAKKTVGKSRHKIYTFIKQNK